MKNGFPGKSAFMELRERLRAPMNSRGVVLIAVIWICAIIMWFSFQISAQTRLQGEDQLHTIRKSQALHLAIGGCYEALARMGQPPPLSDRAGNLNWQPDGRPRLVEYNTGIAIVMIESEDAKLNVNMAQEVQLRQVLQQAGAKELIAEELTDRIMDFIDADDIPRLHGMEKDGYVRLGLNYIPLNGPLTSLDQLLLVPGVSDQLFYGYDQGMDEGMRDLPEIFADVMIPGKNSLFSLLTIYGNNVNLAQNEAQREIMPQPISWKPGSVYRILSFGKIPNGPPSVAIWLNVRFVSNGAKPYTILSRKIM